MKKYIRYKGRGIVGYVENGVYYAHRSSTLHFFRIYGGWGLSIPILAELNDMGVKEICLRIDNLWTMNTELMNFYKYGQKFSDTPDDPQLILSQSYWYQGEKVIEEKQSKL